MDLVASLRFGITNGSAGVLHQVSLAFTAIREIRARSLWIAGA